ncbi:hypothetical protein KAU32_11190 [bacterium]|nr:hypothetical protein [bacterium]
MTECSECKKAGLPEPEYKEEFGGFSVYFYKDIYNEENLRKMSLNERQIEIVLFAKQKNVITLSTYRSLITTVSQKTLYRDLQELVKRGIFKEIGNKKGRKYEII